jgi:nucleoid DNA-binding protein
MRKSAIIQRVAEVLGGPNVQADAAVEAILATMKAALQQGEPIIMRHFGTFAVRAKRARMGRNPKTGAPAAIPARRAVRFKAGRPLKQVVAGTMPPSDAGDSTTQRFPTLTGMPATRPARRRRPTAG